MKFSHSIEGPPGEIWITVEEGSEVPSKYLAACFAPLRGCALDISELRVKFNLTAYVQDMIEAALAK